MTTDNGVRAHPSDRALVNGAALRRLRRSGFDPLRIGVQIVTTA